MELCISSCFAFGDDAEDRLVLEERRKSLEYEKYSRASRWYLDTGQLYYKIYFKHFV